MTPTSLSDDLVAWGRVIELETRGRRSGLPRRVAVGYVDTPDGSLAISATDPETHWARNLLAEPRCRIRDDRGWRDCVAMPLQGDDHRATVSALVLRYGTPSERLGSGPSFRLSCDDGAHEGHSA